MALWSLQNRISSSRWWKKPVQWRHARNSTNQETNQAMLLSQPAWDTELGIRKWYSKEEKHWYCNSEQKSAFLMVQGKSLQRMSEIGSAICTACLGDQLNEQVLLWVARGGGRSLWEWEINGEYLYLARGGGEVYESERWMENTWFQGLFNLLILQRQQQCSRFPSTVESWAEL